MNRLQKKCFIATAGIHLLLVLTLIVGPGFFVPKPKADDLPVLDVIPANLIDAAFNSGVRNAQPPPAPVVTPPQPAPPPPQPVVIPPAPAPEPEPIKPVVKMPAPEPKAAEKPAVSEKPKIQINTQLVSRSAPKNSPAPDNSQQLQQRQTRAINSALRALRSNLSPGTTIDLPGNSSAAYASYAAAVKSVYEQAWQPPDNAANDEANVRVTATIAGDGAVLAAHIITPSGDPGLDGSVQRTLDRVTFIAPFPEGAKEKERTYTINFNLKAKKLLE
jgi:TonB family protein